MIVAFDPTGERLVAGFSKGTVLLWNVATLGTAMSLTGHAGEITSAGFSTDGELLVTTADKTARVWKT